MGARLALPAHRHHITQKVKIGGQRTLYLSVRDDEYPAEILRRLVGDLLAESIFVPCGPVYGHDRIERQGGTMISRVCTRQVLDITRLHVDKAKVVASVGLQEYG